MESALKGGALKSTAFAPTLETEAMKQITLPPANTPRYITVCAATQSVDYLIQKMNPNYQQTYRILYIDKRMEKESILAHGFRVYPKP